MNEKYTAPSTPEELAYIAKTPWPRSISPDQWVLRVRKWMKKDAAVRQLTQGTGNGNYAHLLESPLSPTGLSGSYSGASARTPIDPR